MNESKKLRLAWGARIFEHRNELTVLARDGSALRFVGDSAAMLRVIVDVARQPCTEQAILQRLSELSGEPPQMTPAIEEALRLLAQAGALEDAVAETPRAAPAAGCRLVVALSGGIAAAFAPLLVEQLLARGFRVRVAATPNALRFVSAMALEALTHERVWSELWPHSVDEAVPHIALARWASLVVVSPATATTLSRIARGDCSTLVSALAISTRAPVLLVPAMNELMCEAPAIQRQLQQLLDDGFYIANPTSGLEVADRPDARVPRGGAPLPVHGIVDLVDALRRELVI